jgi:hypothetical protein
MSTDAIKQNLQKEYRISVLRGLFTLWDWFGADTIPVPPCMNSIPFEAVHHILSHEPLTIALSFVDV